MLSEKQLEILKFPFEDYDALICSGAVRTGKTSIAMLSFVDFAMENYNNKLFGICGKTVDSTVKNIIMPYLDLYYAIEKYNLKWRKSEKLLIVERGNVRNTFEIFGGKDESSFQLIQGRTLASVFLDEVVLMPESFVNQALSRCSVEGARYWFSCNPGSPNHWFYKNWILKADERKAKYLHFTLEDNPSLSEKTLERYRNQYVGVFFQRYIQGVWVLAEGLVYQFEPDRHIDDTIPEKGEFYLSIDYGIVNPFVCHLWCVTNKVAYCLDEYYYNHKEHNERKKTDEEHYQSIEALARGYNIESIVIDPSATSFKETINRYGKFNVVNAKNEVISGIGNCMSLLDSEYIKFNSKCKNLFREFGLYSWDDKSLEDRVIKEFDHCLTGDTLVHTENGEVAIKDLVGTTGRVWSYNEETKEAELRPYFQVRQTREKAQIYGIETEDGRVIRCTGEHLILTERGWIGAKDINLSSKILDILKDKHIQIKSIKIDNIEPVYNMEVEYNHNFAVNGGLIVHNCQDSWRYFVNTVLINEFDHLNWRRKEGG